MERTPLVSFGPFRLDSSRRTLWRDGESVTLRPKTHRVLQLLLSRAGQVVSKDEILSTVWDGKAVSEYVLTTCISELRAAMGERSRSSPYLETLHGTGYQLLVKVSAGEDGAEALVAGDRSATACIGRAAELQQLREFLDDARKGRRRIVFVSGDMGVGKTTLVEAFLREVALSRSPGVAVHTENGAHESIARGHCIEQFGAGEPYLPIFEAITRLGRGHDAPFVADALRRNAPAWLAQIPRLASAEERAKLRSEASVPTQESMLRQISDAIEALCEYRVLVLTIEDVHLSDPATLELIANLAKRRGPAHLLLLATARTGELHAGSARLEGVLRDLRLHRLADEIVVAPLPRESIDTYLSERFPGKRIPRDLAATLHARTEGNPLFVTQLVDQLIADGLLHVDDETVQLRADTGAVARQVPRDVRAMIEYRVDSLPPDERALLEVASVAGVSFRARDVAAALGADVESVETLCSHVGRQIGYLRRVDTTDGPSEARFGFRHALYQQVLYERVEATRRSRLHYTIGDSLAAVDVALEGALAAELAYHFDRGAAPERAVDFYDKAALSAVAQAANREAVGYLDRGLELLEGCADDAPHQQRRLDLLLTRGPLILAIHGYGADDVLANYRRSLALARQLQNLIPEMSSLIALAICHLARADLQTAETLAEELVRVAREAGLPQPFVTQLHNPLSQVRLYQGKVAESLALADAAVAAVEVLAMPQPQPEARPALWAEPRVLLHCQRGSAAFSLGLISQAAAAVDQAVAIARELRHPFNLTYALCYASLYEGSVRRWDAAIRFAREAIDVGDAYDIRFWASLARVHGGYALTCSGSSVEGILMLRRGLDDWHTMGGRLLTSLHQNLHADASMRVGDMTGAEIALATAHEHIERTGETLFLAETLRLQAEYLRRCGDALSAQEALLRRAIDTARQQGARLLELRSRLALYRVQPSMAAAEELAALHLTFNAEPLVDDIRAVRAALASEPRTAQSKKT